MPKQPLITEALRQRFAELGPQDYGDDVRARVPLGFCVGAVDYVRAQRLRRWIAEEVATTLDKVDLLASPTSPQVATPIAEGPPALKDPGFVVADGPYNLLRLYALIGIPAVSIPCGFSSEGLPIGLSIAGRAYDDATVLRFADAYERAAGWGTRRPAL